MSSTTVSSSSSERPAITIKYQDRVKILDVAGDFNSKLVAVRDFQKGDVVAPIEGITYGVEKRWSSISENEHIELNSELLYMNHSCDPSVHVNTSAMQVVALKDIRAGDDVTFFYPSSEWSMSQAFPCWCGSSKCIKTISGAETLHGNPLFKVEDHVFNKHILELMAKQGSA
ncbi:uncharacterized protein BJ171DRAFT_579406 [Polychytrium aggregatum]|uniref:uncharacterized protein n=1 Tax=Polychytrium aggregatum TaxID=110093 RepID=UPI0022FDF767|nr:uncharacterized protein BJ171DRAFT_579406 [Polychytrium aggregatum]KAI9207054.1 hypothetical protein BJ171DRAFT_579406 [Polychytrium aggregatum]